MSKFYFVWWRTKKDRLWALTTITDQLQDAIHCAGLKDDDTVITSSVIVPVKAIAGFGTPCWREEMIHGRVVTW